MAGLFPRNTLLTDKSAGRNVGYGGAIVAESRRGWPDRSLLAAFGYRTAWPAATGRVQPTASGSSRPSSCLSAAHVGGHTEVGCASEAVIATLSFSSVTALCPPIRCRLPIWLDWTAIAYAGYEAPCRLLAYHDSLGWNMRFPCPVIVFHIRLASRATSAHGCIEVEGLAS